MGFKATASAPWSFPLRSGATIFAGTANGLSYSSTNGSTWTTWTTANGLGSNTIKGLFLGSTGLYAATTGGLSAYNADGYPTATWTNSGSPINSVFVFGSYIYAGGASGLAVVNGTGVEKTFTPALIVPGSTIASTTVNAVFVDPYQDVFAATDQGLNVLYGGSNPFAFQTPPILINVAVNGIYLDTNGNFYAATDSGLYNLSGTGTQPILAGKTHCVYVDGAGTIYAGTDTGLETSTNGGSTWSKSAWSAIVYAVVTTAPLYSF